MEDKDQIPNGKQQTTDKFKSPDYIFPLTVSPQKSYMSYHQQLPSSSDSPKQHRNIRKTMDPNLTLTVLVTTIDVLRHFETG